MDYKLVGSPCGEHGPYVFYKALKYNKNGKTNILALSEFFFVKLWPDSDFISIGELQLLWEDKNNEQTLASLRLYILPENTPDGRMDIHGEDEVLAITEKVVIRVEDLLTWITHATDWTWGLGAVWEQDCPQAEVSTNTNIKIDMEDVNKEKQNLGVKHWESQTGVVVLSYSKYCRYRGIARRLEGVANKWLKTALVVALGGFTAPFKNTKVLFCKDTFDYPELEGHELLCNHLVPKLKGRPRKRKKASASPEGSESESESSHSTSSTNSKSKAAITAPSPTKLNVVRPRLRCTALAVSNNRPNRGPGPDERNFLINLHEFMRERKTPIGKIPVVGFKEVNLYKLYRKVKELGGYDVVTAGKLWKFVYEVMGGEPTCTSAATLSRRHYEKLLLPYERHMVQWSTKHKPTLSLPPVPLPHDRAKNQTSVRSVRTAKQEKGEKENIPQRNTRFSTPPSTTSTSSPKPEKADDRNQVVDKPAKTSPAKGAPAPDKPVKEAAPAPDKPAKAAPVPDKPAKAAPAPEKSAKAAPAPEKSAKAAPAPEKSVKAAPAPEKSAKAAPAPEKSAKPAPPASDKPAKTAPPASDKPAKNPAQQGLGPMLKKQKLEILKEGGLEVTPVAANGGSVSSTSGGSVSSTSSGIVSSTSSSSNPVSNGPAPPPRQLLPPSRPSLPARLPPTNGRHQPESPYKANGADKMSITVTPDISHLLCPPGPSKRAIYSNPKEMFTPQMQTSQQFKRSSLPEVLDLRTKPRLNIGSNLEITLVPPKPKPAPAHQPPAASPVPLLVNRKKNQQQQQQQQQQQNHHQFKGLPIATPKQGVPFHQPYPGSYKPFVPVVDPLFFSGLYNAAAAGLPAGFPPAATGPRVATTDQLAFYKELLKHQFPSLMRDGSTSITLVGQTPTSK